MNPIDTLTTLFMKFPGIGTRQARRFVYFLLNQNPRFLDDLTREIGVLKASLRQCKACYRYYPHTHGGVVCSLCTEAEPEIMMVVEKDTDLEAVHKSGVHKGLFFVLGGTIPVLEKDPESRIRLRELEHRIEEAVEQGLGEVIFALSATPEGDFTRDYLTRSLLPLAERLQVRFTGLGRGLSTGSELEYSDAETLKQALKNRG